MVAIAHSYTICPLIRVTEAQILKVIGDMVSSTTIDTPVDISTGVGRGSICGDGMFREEGMRVSRGRWEGWASKVDVKPFKTFQGGVTTFTA